jgi:hypothetical protein
VARNARRDEGVTPVETGPDDGRGLLPAAFAVLRRLRRPLYGVALAVTGMTAAAVCAIAVLGFALAWEALADFREHVEYNIANEEPPYAATGDSEVVFTMTGMLAVLLLFGLAIVALALVNASHAVAVRHARHGRGPLGTADLWRSTRPVSARVLAVQLPGAVLVAVSGLVGYSLFGSMAWGSVPGIDRPHAPFRGYDALDWVAGLGLPLLAASVGPYLYARLSLAGSAVVFEDAPAGRALRRSWTLTRIARGTVVGVWLAATAFVAAVFLLLRQAAAPLGRPAEAFMLRIGDGNAHAAAALVFVTPPAVAFALLPVAALPPVFVVLPVLYTRLRAREGERPRWSWPFQQDRSAPR